MAESRTRRLQFGVLAMTVLTVFAVAMTAGGAVAAPDCAHCQRGGGGAASGSGASDEGALQEVELQDRLRRLLRQPAVCRQPDERTRQRRQEHRLRAGREDGRQPQRARRGGQPQDAPERGHRRVRRLPGPRGLPAGDLEALQVGAKIPAVSVVGAIFPDSRRSGWHRSRPRRTPPSTWRSRRRSSSRARSRTSSVAPSRHPDRRCSRVTRAPSPASSRCTRTSAPNHIIQVKTEGTATTAYNTTLSALSRSRRTPSS